MPAIPNALPLGNPVIPIPSIIRRPPEEGDKSIPFVVDWSRPIARSLDTVSINLQGNSPLDFRQITGLIVDNSQCGASLDFIFPDTDVTISIPAYAPYTVLQVNSRALEFYVRALGPIPSDRTSFAILNYAPLPVSVPATEEQQIGSAIGISATPGSSTDLVPVTVAGGTLQDLSVSFSILNSASSGFAIGEVTDRAASLGFPANRVLARVKAVANNTDTINVNLLSLSGVNLRFIGGLLWVPDVGIGLPGGEFAVNAVYRTP